MIDDDLDPRLAAWFEDGPAGLSPEARAHIREAVARRRQRRRLPRWWPWRAPRIIDAPASRRRSTGGVVLAAFALLAIVGWRVVVDPAVTGRDTTVPTAPPTPSVAAQDAALLDGTWTTSDPATGLPGGTWELSLGEWALVSRPAVDGDPTDTYALWLRPVTVSGDELDIPAPLGAACAGQAASYHWRIDGGDVLRLSPVADDCSERRAALAPRAWTRRWNGIMRAGSTYRAEAAPRIVAMTVPQGVALEGTSEPPWSTYVATLPGTNQIVLVSVVETVYVDPCDITKSVTPFDGTPGDLADFLAAVPQIHVRERSSTTIDGRPAVRLTFDIDLAAATSCRSGMVAYWIDAGTMIGEVAGGARQGGMSSGGTTEQMDIVEVDGMTVAISVQAPTATFDAWLRRIGPMVESATFEP